MKRKGPRVEGQEGLVLGKTLTPGDVLAGP
jgi:hypothetical protein